MSFLSLKDIDEKLLALNKRHEELDAKSVKAGPNGIVFDGAALSAMQTIQTEIARLEKLREREMVADLIGDQVPDEASPSHIFRSSTIPPLPIELPLEQSADPLEGLETLPSKGEDFEQFQKDLWSYCVFRSQRIVHDTRNELAELPGKIDAGRRRVSFTQGIYSGMMLAIAHVMHEAKMIGALGRERRNQLEEKLLARIEALEARPSTKYCGTWNDHTLYEAGNFVTHQGSVFHAKTSTRLRPGEGADWQLAVKRGRDGKDFKQ